MELPAAIAPRTRAGRERLLSALQLTPATTFLLAFLVAPLGIFLVYSFWVTRSYQLVSEWTLSNYVDALKDGVYRTLFAKTLEIAVTAAAITVVLAYSFAHAIRFHLRRFQEPLLFLVIVALFSGYLVRIYAWRTILGDEGLINNALRRLGL